MCIQRPNLYESAAEERGGVFADYDFCDTNLFMCEHGVAIPDDTMRWEVCSDCAENLASEQAEGSVGK